MVNTTGRVLLQVTRRMAGYLATLVWATGLLVWVYVLYKLVRFMVLRRIYSTGEALLTGYRGEWGLVTGR